MVTQCDNCGLGYWTSASFPPHPIIPGNVSWGNYCEFWMKLISPLSLLLLMPLLPLPCAMPWRIPISQVIHSSDHFLSAQTFPEYRLCANKRPWESTLGHRNGKIQLSFTLAATGGSLKVRQKKKKKRKHSKYNVPDTKRRVYMSVLWDKEEEILIQPENTIMKF